MMAPLTRLPKIGFLKLIGCDVVFWREGYAEIEAGAEHANRDGIAHGGVLASLVDVACAAADSFDPNPETRRPVMTLAMTTTFFRAKRAHGLDSDAEPQVGGTFR